MPLARPGTPPHAAPSAHPGSACPWAMPSGRAGSPSPRGCAVGATCAPSSTSPSAPVPPGTPEARPGMGRGTLVPTLCPPMVSCAPWGMGSGMLGVQGMEERDIPEASCCSTGGSWGTHVPGAMCGINAKEMPWAWGPYSSRMALPACASGSPWSAGHRRSWGYSSQQRACTRTLPVPRGTARAGAQAG